MMPCHICAQCGTQYSEAEHPPSTCCICSDERQFVNPEGQQWTTHAQLKRAHRNTVRAEGIGVTGIGVEPRVGIGQRALVIRGVDGNLLWDCVPLLDDGLAELIRGVGGLRAIAISHPHFHTTMVDWAHAFGCPLYIHGGNRQWVMRADPSVRFWEDETLKIFNGMTLIRCGGHFPGSAILHHDRSGGEIFTSDTFFVNPDHRTLGWMYSFPNYIPLSAAEVRQVTRAIERFDFQRIYGQWWGAVITDGGKDCIRRSRERYVAAIEGKHEEL
ncbi:MAG: MBL fold metallo-hydrolase [Terriglobia bacterium]